MFQDVLSKSFHLCITYRQCNSSSPYLAHMLAWDGRYTRVISQSHRQSSQRCMISLACSLLTTPYITPSLVITTQHYPGTNSPEGVGWVGGGGGGGGGMPSRFPVS